jgi:hypothetical protein
MEGPFVIFLDIERMLQGDDELPHDDYAVRVSARKSYTRFFSLCLMPLLRVQCNE